MINKTAITTLIDEKYLPLDKKYKLGAFILLMILPVVIFYLFFYQPNAKSIEQLKKQKIALTREVKKIEARVANRPKFLKELEETEATFAKSSVLLPGEKEIPSLLTNISALGRSAGLDFLSFKPKPNVAKDFYKEVPISIAVRGPYHSVGLFFNQVSKLERIVTVASVAMTNPRKEGPDILLNSKCELMTYRFTNQAISRPHQGTKR